MSDVDKRLRYYNGDRNDINAVIAWRFGFDDESRSAKPICWHCCKPIEDDEEYEVIDGDMYYHVGCLID